MNFEFERKKIEELKKVKLYREVKSLKGLDFCSNDYLGFANDPELKSMFFEYGLKKLGSTGSRLIGGNSDIIELLEGKLSAISGLESSLFFPSGYQCNLGVLSTLIQNEDVVFSDELNHASIIDGLRLTRAKKIIYPHCDLNTLESFLRTHARYEKKWIVTESIFSMDGDSPDLCGLVELAEKYGARLIIDEAHATGLFEGGAGLVKNKKLEKRIFATIHMCGKAWGLSGAWVNCSPIIRNYLVNFSRPFIYSTAPSDLQIIGQICALEHWNKFGFERIKKLKLRMLELNKIFNSEKEFSPILPLMTRDIQSTLELQSQLEFAGFAVKAIRYPTVATNKPRLRVTVPYTRTDEEFEKFKNAISDLKENFKC